MKPLTWIIAEAKKLKKQYPKRYSKWTDYVKQASAIYSSKHAGKSPVGKKKVSAVSGNYGMFSKEGNKKVTELVKYAIKHKLTVPELRKKILILEKTYPEILDTAVREYIYEAVYEKGGVKEYISGMKKTVKKKPVKKTATKLHKDTNSHNVKISVISGTPRMYFIDKQNELDKIKSLINYNNDIQEHLNKWKYRLKTDKSETFIKFQKKQVIESIKKYTNLLKSNKKYLIELKKAI
jgi:hypothetical protein